MAAPIYSTDLITIADAESTTGWSALGGGASGLAVEPDFTIQGSNSIAKQIKAELKGHGYQDATARTCSGSNHAFVWVYVATPGTIDTLANGGLRVTLGANTTNRREWTVNGKEEYKLGGWKCYIVDARETEDYLVGTNSGASFNFVGAVMNGTVSVKAPNLGVDAVRFGGRINVTEGDLATPANFTDAAAENDLTTNSWGIFSKVDGGFSQQGKLFIGTATTAARFEDANKQISFADTPKATAFFTKVSVNNAGTVCILDNITFNSLGTQNRGYLEIVTASSVDLTSPTFINNNPTFLHSSATVTDGIWRGCRRVEQLGATLNGCQFLSGISDTSQVISDDPGLISGCRFVSSGSQHGVEAQVAGTYTFDSNTFEGYAATNGSTGNEAFYNSSGGHITLNLTGTASAISVRNSAGSTTTVNNTKSFTFNLSPTITTYEWRIYQVTTLGSLDGAVELDGEEAASASSQSYLYSYVSDINLAVQILPTLGSDYEESITYYTAGNSDQTVTINLQKDNNN